MTDLTPETKQAISEANATLNAFFFAAGKPEKRRCLGCHRVVAASNESRVHANPLCEKKAELRARMRQHKEEG